MTRFRSKKMVTAVQWFQHGDHPDVMQIASREESGLFEDLRAMETRRVNPGDWIVTDDSNVTVVMTPDEFAAAFEPLEEQEPRPNCGSTLSM